MAVPVDELLAGLESRQPRAIARAISLAEGGGEPLVDLARRIQPRLGRARLVGITGPPGAGKSTLTSALVELVRQRGETVGILAVDPTSPITGGALLGDRLRMPALTSDPGVFIRSMATRGAVGGLARAAHDALDILDAAGFDWVVVETVGVGQDEVDVVRCVDTVVVVTVPGLGDEVQALKAGITEIGDLFVVNKIDRDGGEQAARDLEMMLALSPASSWRPPVLRTVASRRLGVEALLAAIEQHREHAAAAPQGDARRLARLRLRVEIILRDKLLAVVHRELDLDGEIASAREAGIDPYAVAERLLARLLGARP